MLALKLKILKAWTGYKQNTLHSVILALEFKTGLGIQYMLNKHL